MSLIFCPECGHEISVNAIACPNCGRPLVAPEPPVTVVRRQEDGFSAWGYAAIGGSTILLILLMFLLFRGANDDSNVNVALRANANRAANIPVTRTDIPPTEPSTVSVPPSSGMPVMPTTGAPPTTTSVPGSSSAAPVMPDKGTAVIQAKVVDRRGNPQPARSARFYLLDADPEEILSHANVPAIEGNSLTSSLGLAAVYPDKFGDFQRAAMRAIGQHSKYSGTTDSSGQAKLSGVAPKEYFLFCVFRVGSGFAMWNSPVTINPGDNQLDLSPQSVTEITDTSGE